MKRSEMIQIMMRAFEEDFDDARWMSRNNAEKVLTAMEEAGMLPPSYQTRLGNGLECKICAWEPEDE